MKNIRKAVKYTDKTHCGRCLLLCSHTPSLLREEISHQAFTFDNGKRRKKTCWKQGGYSQRTSKLCFVLDLRISHIKKIDFPFCSFPPSVSHPFSGAKTAIFHDHKHLWDSVRLCECVHGVWCLCCWCLKGKKTAGVFLTFLGGLYLFSPARVGSTICFRSYFPTCQ